MSSSGKSLISVVQTCKLSLGDLLPRLEASLLDNFMCFLNSIKFMVGVNKCNWWMVWELLKMMVSFFFFLLCFLKGWFIGCESSVVWHTDPQISISNNECADSGLITPIDMLSLNQNDCKHLSCFLFLSEDVSVQSCICFWLDLWCFLLLFILLGCLTFGLAVYIPLLEDASLAKGSVFIVTIRPSVWVIFYPFPCRQSILWGCQLLEQILFLT